MTLTRIPIAALAIFLATSLGAHAQDATPLPEPSTTPAPTTADATRVLTPEEKTEKEGRKACKLKLCDIIATKNPVGDDVSCDIAMTFREADLVKMLGGKISWPWGKASCKAKLEMKREPLAKAMSEPSGEITMTTQKVTCTLDQKAKGDPYVVEISVAPKMSFENGKAVVGIINWGDASAPLFIYPVIYAGTGIDNSTNVLGPELVRMVNTFSTKKCAEVKDELPSNKPN